MWQNVLDLLVEKTDPACLLSCGLLDHCLENKHRKVFQCTDNVFASLVGSLWRGEELMMGVEVTADECFPAIW